jgi:hypothetical protein
MRTHVTHLVHVVHAVCTEGNPSRPKPLPSVDDIREIAESELEEDAILMARNEITCLDDLSLEGDVPDDMSDK